jgi:hypothetical protein
LPPSKQGSFLAALAWGQLSASKGIQEEQTLGVDQAGKIVFDKNFQSRVGVADLLNTYDVYPGLLHGYAYHINLTKAYMIS